MKDDEATPEEEREAAALARALGEFENTPDRVGAGGLRPTDPVAGGAGPSQGPAIDDALETAGLLRFSQARLDPARAEGLRAELRARVRPRRRAWWAAAPAALAAAALVLLWVRRPTPPALPLPPPPATLLAAQGQAARGDAQALEALEQQMRAYRRTMLARLRESER